MQFAEEKLEPFIGGEIRTSVLYDRCRDWCRENGCFAENSRNFPQGLKAFAEVKRKRPANGSMDGATNMIIGCKLKNVIPLLFVKLREPREPKNIMFQKNGFPKVNIKWLPRLPETFHR